MDDATLPEHPTPPRRSPVEAAPPPTLDPAPSSDCVSDGSDVTTSSNNSTSSPLKEERSGDSEGRSDGGKQKRKRTRYVGPSGVNVSYGLRFNTSYILRAYLSDFFIDFALTPRA
jgi:hypothetical protein